MTEPLILSNAQSDRQWRSAPHTVVPGAIVPSFGTMMMPLRM
jgi:hypothetical protein